MKASPLRRVTVVVIAAAACGFALAGCAASSTPVEASEFTPPVTEEGAALLAAFDDCSVVAEALGASLEGYAIEVDSIDATGGFCDWRSEASPGQTIGVQIAPQPNNDLPDASSIEASGGVIVANEQLTASGGVLYRIPSEVQGAFSATGLLPGASVSIAAAGFEVTPETEEQLTAAVVEILGHTPASQ
ncbi:hypothetical protein [Microbacterium allomyrinae]|uniref:DUF3558 domain-containing protein n=1 Tax=Microbacterium allomyrinae TaxID=2830666 RepID=A0A9X1S409_9MICO|nr:hypothetical protein [Microbacterium allomyrinae]MCC2033749.1 hypothetical protein [Microbacterium allomyrinae]